MSIPYTVALLGLSILMIIGTIAIGKLFDYIRRLVDMVEYHQQRLDLYNVMLEYHQKRLDLYNVRIKNLQTYVKYLLVIIKEKNK